MKLVEKYCILCNCELCNRLDKCDLYINDKGYHILVCEKCINNKHNPEIFRMFKGCITDPINLK